MVNNKDGDEKDADIYFSKSDDNDLKIKLRK